MTRNGLIYIAITLLILFDGVTGFFIFKSGHARGILLTALHLVFAGLFFALFRKVEDKRFVEKHNFTLLALILAMAVPVYGMLGMTIIHLFVKRAEVQRKDYFAMEQEFLPESHKGLLKNVDQHVIGIARDELDIDAFQDIFQGSDRQMEESAINKISRSLTKNAVRLLKDVIQTSTSDTRVMAASALIEMEGRVVKKIEALRERLADKPTHMETVLELARTYDLYCYLDVLEPALESYYQELTIQQYEYLLRFHPEHPEANLEYGRILLNSGDNQKAIAVLTRIRNMAPDDINSRIWLAEAHYNGGDLANVRRICRELMDFESIPERIKDVVTLWSPVTEAESHGNTG